MTGPRRSVRWILPIVLLLSSVTSAAEAPLVTLAGRFAPPREATDEFVLRVFVVHLGGQAEILHEGPLARGRFRVEFPRPPGYLRAVVTSKEHPPIELGLGPEIRSKIRIRDPLTVPDLMSTTLRVRSGGERASGARVLVQPGHPPAFYRRVEGRTDEDGQVTLRTPGGESIRVRIESETGILGPLRIAPSEDPVPVFLGPRRLRLHARIIGPQGALVPGIEVTTLAGARLESDGKSGFRLPLGVDRVRVRAKGYRSIELTGVASDPWRGGAREIFPRAATVPGRGKSLLRVELDWRESVWGGSPGTGALTCVAPLDSPVRVRPVGLEGWKRLRPENGGHVVELHPGPYEVEVEGGLGALRSRRVVVTAESDLVERVSMSGGSAIRIATRDRRGKVEETVSFSVTDAAGQAARAVYESPADSAKPFEDRPMATRSEPFADWPVESHRFTDVTNGGLIHLRAGGTWRLNVLRPDGDAVVLEVKTYADVITRVEVRTPTAR